MKLFLGAITVGLFLSLQAHADRWVLKNPQDVPSRLEIVSQFELKSNQYTIIETEDYKADLVDLAPSLELMLTTMAEAAFPDLDIGVRIMPGTSLTPAWHVERMRYAEIPAGLSGEGVIVAVLDTGVDFDHEALASHIWNNAEEIPANEIDDDGNGYVDDVLGYNFSDKNNSPTDQYSHGTHCAGIIAADTRTEDGARGVAQGVKIMPIKIIGSNYSGFLSDAALGIRYAVDNGAHILSNSWRIYKSWSTYYNEEGVKLVADALEYASQRHVIFVAAAGNESLDLSNTKDPMFPGGMEGHPNLFVVGATQSDDNYAVYSNYGHNVVHVASPGSDIISTIPGGGWSSMSGTSMATPLVAGVLALGLQKGHAPQEALQRLIQTSAESTWKSKLISGGIVDIIEYLQ